MSQRADIGMEAPAAPWLSVVVCTHSRPEDLESCLQAFACLERLDEIEVIVVDSASCPPVADLVARFESSVPRLLYVYEREPGLSRARNRGAAVALSPLIAFVDDDAAPVPSWGATIAAAFDADPSIGVVGGACRASFQCERPRWLSDRLLCFAGITRFGTVAREARNSVEWPFGANLAVRAQALRAAGGFSEELGRTGKSLLSGEESALVASVQAAGWKIWLEPAAIVDHTVPPARCVSRYYWRRLWWQGVGRARAHRSARLTLRLLVAAAVRMSLLVVTRDRSYLYRTAETAGYLIERVRIGARGGPGSAAS